MLASTLQAAGADEKFRGRIVSPDSVAGTCDGVGGSRTIDYFIVSEGLTDAITGISVLFNAGLAPHRPVKLQFRSKVAALRVRQLRKPQALPTQAVIGPRFEAEGWDRVTREINAIRANLLGGSLSRDSALPLADSWLKVLADKLEQEVSANT